MYCRRNTEFEIQRFKRRFFVTRPTFPYFDSNFNTAYVEHSFYCILYIRFLSKYSSMGISSSGAFSRMPVEIALFFAPRGKKIFGNAPVNVKMFRSIWRTLYRNSPKMRTFREMFTVTLRACANWFKPNCAIAVCVLISILVRTSRFSKDAFLVSRKFQLRKYDCKYYEPGLTVLVPCLRMPFLRISKNESWKSCVIP